LEFRLQAVLLPCRTARPAWTRAPSDRCLESRLQAAHALRISDRL